MAASSEKREMHSQSGTYIQPEAMDMLKLVLENEVLHAGFRAFCLKSWCIENLLFYLDVQSFENDYASLDKLQVQERAQYVKNTYLLQASVLEVNIDDITSKHARDLVDLGDVSKSVFQAAVVEVERQLRYDVLAKWENTADFIYTIKKAGLDDSSSTYSGLQQSHHSPGQTVPSSPKLTEVDVEMGDLTR